MPPLVATVIDERSPPHPASASATIFSRLIEMWKPEQVVIPRIGLKEGLLLNLAEELRNEECRLSLGKEVPVLQVHLPQVEVGS